MTPQRQLNQILDDAEAALLIPQGVSRADLIVALEIADLWVCAPGTGSYANQQESLAALRRIRSALGIPASRPQKKEAR